MNWYLPKQLTVFEEANKSLPEFAIHEAVGDGVAAR